MWFAIGFGAGLASAILLAAFVIRGIQKDLEGHW
jgi:hypothetical protein